MQKFEDRIQSWKLIGERLTRFIKGDFDDSDAYFADLQLKVNRAVHHNGWFEKQQVLHALTEWSMALSDSSLSEWLNKYSSESFNPSQSKRVGIVMAGNIPLVGLHDLLSVTISGHTALVKMSSDDNQLLPAILDGSDLLHNIEWVERLTKLDAVIATGSDNSARYFEYYFGKYPNVIRKNRKSVAVLQGDESEGELTKLGEDVFRYFGMGCRSISKIYIPQDFDVDRIFSSWLPYQGVVDNHKYANNYDYHRALLLMDRMPFLENGFVILREHERMATPVGTIHVERYEDIDAVWKQLRDQREAIQCIASKQTIADLPVVGLGETQSPKLWDYADGVDTLKFLTELH